MDAYGVEIEPLLVDGLRNVDNSLTRLGRTVFLRAEGDRPLDGSAFGSVMDQLGAEVLHEVPGDQRMMNVEVVWDTPDAALDEAITDDVDMYLAMPFELMSVAPWAPGGISSLWLDFLAGPRRSWR